MINEARKVMKWCQIGVRNADEGNNLAAECYGTIGQLILEIERLRALAGRLADSSNRNIGLPPPAK